MHHQWTHCWIENVTCESGPGVMLLCVFSVNVCVRTGCVELWYYIHTPKHTSGCLTTSAVTRPVCPHLSLSVCWKAVEPRLGSGSVNILIEGTSPLQLWASLQPPCVLCKQTTMIQSTSISIHTNLNAISPVSLSFCSNQPQLGLSQYQHFIRWYSFN